MIAATPGSRDYHPFDDLAVAIIRAEESADAASLRSLGALAQDAGEHQMADMCYAKAAEIETENPPEE